MADPTPLHASRRYDASSRAPRLASWLTPGTDATTAIDRPDLLRNRARDLVRNNPWAARGVSALVNGLVGFGIRAQWQSRSKNRAKAAQALWSAWAETPACDADGLHDFYGLQVIAARSLVESGECLVRLRPRRMEDGLPVPMQIQLLEPDLLADDATPKLPTGHTIRRGIEFDALGRRVAYHLRRAHPGADLWTANQDIVRVDAREIIHLYRVDRPGQIRGVSWLAPVIVTLRELGIYEDAYLKRQQLASLFAGFVTSEATGTAADEMEAELPDLQPGTLYMLPPGRNIDFTQPPPSGEDPAYRDSTLRRVAAGLGLSYEALTGNLSEVNFSSARMGAQEMARSLESWQWHLFIPRLCQGVARWFLDARSLMGEQPGDLRTEWSPPGRTIVDPTREYEALQTAVQAGFLSLPEAIRQQGYDPDAWLAEHAEFIKKVRDAELALSTDYINVARNSGTQRTDTTQEGSTNA